MVNFHPINSRLTERRRDLQHPGDLTTPGSASLPVSDQTSSHREAARRHLERLAKPPGSHGRLEDLAGRLCTIQGTLAPRTRPRRVVVFVSDRGVVAEGVTARQSSVAAAMIHSIVRGGAACAARAAACDADLVLVDVGSRSEPLPPRPAGDADNRPPDRPNVTPPWHRDRSSLDMSYGASADPADQMFALSLDATESGPFYSSTRQVPPARAWRGGE